MLSMKRKKPRKRIVVRPSITLDAGASSPRYGAYRDRTGDLRLAKPALSQLS